MWSPAGSVKPLPSVCSSCKGDQHFLSPGEGEVPGEDDGERQVQRNELEAGSRGRGNEKRRRGAAEWDAGVPVVEEHRRGATSWRA